MAATIFAGWDFALLGTATLAWTDDNGAHSVSFTTGRYSHVSLTTVLGDYAEFGDALETAMNAETTETITVTAPTASVPTYTIAVTGATLTLTFTGAAGLIMRNVLGFTGSITGATSHTSYNRPFYLIVPYIDGRTNYAMPFASEGRRSAIAANGEVYVTGPVSVPRRARWEHHHQAQATVHAAFAVADNVNGGAPWTWEDFFDHAFAYSYPCLYVDDTVSQVFQLLNDFDESAHRRFDPRMDMHQIVHIEASVRGYL